MKEEFIGRVDVTWFHDPVVEIVSKSEHGGTYETDIRDLFKSLDGKEVKITIELVDAVEPEEDMVTVTYKELFHRCSNSQLNIIGVNVWYLKEGGDPTAIRDIPKSEALMFMSEEEFNGRCHSSVNA